jgi:hypothetical protein
VILEKGVCESVRQNEGRRFNRSVVRMSKGASIEVMLLQQTHTPNPQTPNINPVRQPRNQNPSKPQTQTQKPNKTREAESQKLDSLILRNAPIQYEKAEVTSKFVGHG